jgi:hypothetical protein
VSAGALAALSPSTVPFTLRVGGRILTAVSPVAFPGDDGAVGSCTISETAEGSPNRMTWTVEDATGSITFDHGEQVELVDRRSGSERLLFGGHLVEVVSRRRGGGKGRILTCTALGYDAWLDWRFIPSWSSRTDKNGRITKITSERAMVQQLINRYAGFLEAPSSLITNQNTTMEVVSVRKMTLREALERVGETATYADDDSVRYFYVDNAKRLHWYRGSEDLTAPYRVGDGSYTRMVMDTSGLVSLWPLREATGTTVYDAMRYADGTLAGSYTQNVTGGIVNEPGLRALTLDGSTGYMTATGSNLHPGDTFSFECWFKRASTGSIQMLWSGPANDFEVRFEADDTLSLRKVNVSTIWNTSATVTDTSWHHLAVTKSGSTRVIYLDGAALSATGTNATIVAGSGAIEVGRRLTANDRYFNGSLQHVALYNVALSAATVLAHYNQGITLVPDDWEYVESSFEGREAVHVSGGNADGTGWVRNPSIVRTAFGAPNRQPERQEGIDRDDAEGPGKRRAYGRWFLKANNDPMKYGRFTIVGYDGWRVGQRVYLTSVPDGLDGYAAEVKSIDTDVGFGSGVLTYDIQWGRPKYSGARAVARNKRRGR